MLVWQDMPSMFYEDPFNAGIAYRQPQEKAQHMHELQRMVEARSLSQTAAARIVGASKAREVMIRA